MDESDPGAEAQRTGTAAGGGGRVLLTGGSSLIGRELAAALVQRGVRVRCFQRGTPAPPPSVDESTWAGWMSTEPAAAARLDVVHGDVRDATAVADAAQGCAAIVHLAAKVGVAGAYEEYWSVNVGGTANVAAAAHAAGIDRLVHVSSPSVAHHGEPIVGSGADQPSAAHAAAYPATKADAERLALGAASSTLGVVAVRPHLVWGPGDTQLVGRILDRARSGRLALVGGGTALVDTTYIDNAVAALVAALDAVAPGAACSGRAYVIANGEPRPIRELVAGICAAGGVECAPRTVPVGVARAAGSVVERVYALTRPDAEPPLTRFLAEQLGTAHWFDLRPAREDLGWSPSVTTADGLLHLARWFAAGGGAST